MPTVTGIDSNTLTDQLQSGTPLSSILQSKGVTFAQVRQAVRAQAAQTGVTGHHHRSQEGAIQFAQALANRMGMPETDLLQQLANGSSLSDIATSHGMSTDALVSTIQDVMTRLGGYSASGTPTMPSIPPTQIDAVS